jgi:hypothetical protein
MTIPDESPRTVRLTVTVTPGTSVALVIELMKSIRAQPAVQDVTWEVPPVPGRQERPADWQFCDQIMWLIEQVAPV